MEGSKAYLLVTCDTGSEEYVVNRLNNIEQVKDAHGTFGMHDVIAKIESENDLELTNVITRIIRKISGISSTLTLTVNPNIQFEKKVSLPEKDVLKKNLPQAYVLIHCEINDEENILSHLNGVPEVTDADCVIDDYELICKVIAPMFTNVSDIITKKIRTIENIKSTVTLNIIPKNE